MADEKSTVPAVPAQVRGKRSASGEHVLFTPEELEGLELGSLRRRVADLEGLVQALRDELAALRGNMTPAQPRRVRLVEAFAPVDQKDPRRE